MFNTQGCTAPIKADDERKASYRIIKTMGGFYMARKYTHMKELEAQILEMRKEGKSKREIAEHFGLSKEQVKNYQ